MYMVTINETACPNCGGRLKYYDTIQRIVRTQGRNSKWIEVRRLKCIECLYLHRELPEYIYPYKQYEAEVITGVLEGLITTDTFGYEDYPCEATMIRWRTRK